MMRKALMVAATVALTSAGKHVQILASMGIMLGFLVFHVYARPYKNNMLNVLETSALITAVITLYGGLYLFTGTNVNIIYVTTWFVTVVNMLWLLLFLGMFCKNASVKILEKFGIKVRVMDRSSIVVLHTVSKVFVEMLDNISINHPFEFDVRFRLFSIRKS